MSWNAIFSSALVTWFIALAVAEASFQRHEGRAAGSDSRLLTNFTLGALGVEASGILPLANIASSVLAQRLQSGLLVGQNASWMVGFVLTVVAQTLAAYWTHRAMHGLPLLWRVHRVHHSDTAVDVSTGLRHHPLEYLVTAPATVLVILLVGAPVSAVLAAQAFLVATAFFGHTDIHLPPRLDRALALIVVTPRVHRLHHHPARHFHDRNYSDTFTFWDRLFGTFSDMPDRLPIGLDRQPGRPDHIIDQILSPIRSL